MEPCELIARIDALRVEVDESDDIVGTVPCCAFAFFAPLRELFNCLNP